MAIEGLSWKEQLKQVKTKVAKAEEEREQLKRLQLERSREAVEKRLKEDTPEALTAALAELKKEYTRSSRAFYAYPELERGLSRLAEFGSKLRFYKDCQKEYGKIFTPRTRQTIDQLLRDLGEVQRGFDKQLSQWRAIERVLADSQWRGRQSEDDGPLVDIAKTFNEEAHGVPLSLPKDFFASEKEDFYVVQLGGAPYGYVKYRPANDTITFAVVRPPRLDAGVKLNFSKFVRGLLHGFSQGGPMDRSLDSLNVRLSYAREVKFFTDLGFTRAETHGMSDWTYSCSLVQASS